MTPPSVVSTFLNASSLTLLLLFCGGCKNEESDVWVSLFDGKSLDGWTQLNGQATYRVEEGAIVGKTKEGSRNSFLCTEALFGDFELLFDVRVDVGLNSGVQIRSIQWEEAKKNWDPGRVNGPQVEIVNGRTTNGWIFGEAMMMGGWLYPKGGEMKTPEGYVNPFMDEQWNSYRVIAEGPRIQTFVNGVPVIDYVDEKIYETHSRGFIGLQVHGIKEGTGPFEVRWRNLKIREL